MYSLLKLAQNAGPKEPKAGHKLAFEFARQAAKITKLDVILLINRGEIVDYSVWKDIGCEVVYVEEYGSLKKIFSMIKFAFRIPPRFCVRVSSTSRRFILKLLESKQYDEVLFEFSQSIPYIDVVSKCKVKTIASIHDIQTQLVSRGNIVDRYVLMKATVQYEKKMLRKFDAIYTLSEKDSELIKNLFDCKNVLVRPPIIDQRFLEVKRDISKIESNSMLFWGAMDRKENSDSIKKFIRDVLPVILENLPEAKLYIVGNKPSESLRRLANDHVIITGYVDEPFAYFEKAHIGIVPLLRGAGVKIKTLEMLAAGLKVVATDIGAEGIDKNDHLFIEDISLFGKKIVTLLKKHRVKNQ